MTLERHKHATVIKTRTTSAQTNQETHDRANWQSVDWDNRDCVQLWYGSHMSRGAEIIFTDPFKGIHDGVHLIVISATCVVLL